MSWVYIKSESKLWTVGFYTPNGGWVPDTDHPTAEQAAARVHYLNGGNEPVYVEPKDLESYKGKGS